jgi:hypothetical protein
MGSHAAVYGRGNGSTGAGRARLLTPSREVSMWSCEHVAKKRQTFPIHLSIQKGCYFDHGSGQAMAGLNDRQTSTNLGPKSSVTWPCRMRKSTRVNAELGLNTPSTKFRRTVSTSMSSKLSTSPSAGFVCGRTDPSDGRGKSNRYYKPGRIQPICWEKVVERQLDGRAF